ncbi:glycosyltransferase family 31 protein [Aaosphaeria arxii CBS 175.79]|uniref:Glycosyltransferase family 31 protein n=1 Tax=Aaosphaeria arxii CBS 175.79 TaxID=1450172 RepID=A0A6A5X954_9PLEO|nr:glycosyltransferase family 31 protein [Aaosphaeria arxii CBS 175.79]KAF2009482.1 glycosyltransferase family 31 protein [Aaosphaeria arxii CBS 175.79]
MPLFTPSRIIVIIAAFSLFTLFWSWGTSSGEVKQAFPGGQTEKPQNPAAHPAPHPATPQQQPGEKVDGDNKDDIRASMLSSIVLTPTPIHTSTPTPIAKNTETSVKKQDNAGNVVGDKTVESKQEASTETIKQQETSTTESSSHTQAAVQEAKTSATEEVKAGTPSNPTTLVKAISTSKPAVVAQPTPSAPKPEEQEIEKFCNKVKGAPQIMIVLRTSKGEIEEKLSTHLKTLLACAPNFAIFSDHSGAFEGHKVHDALEDISDKFKQQHAEFKQYEDMKTQAVQAGTVDKELDKWKFLPMVYRAYQMNPDSRFWMFIEADTSLSWTNVLQWINRLDYRIPYYSGAPTFLTDVKFAQRGAGIFISQGAMRLYAKSYREHYATTWEPRVSKECCGDMVLSVAMSQAHVEFYDAFPKLQSETPATIDWTNLHWCSPMVSWHPMNADDLSMIWEAERNWTSEHGWSKPFHYGDAFVQIIEPQLEAVKNDWDNISADSKIVKPPGANEADPSSDWAKYSEELRNAVKSPEDCKKVCELATDCVQWKHSTKGEGECYSGKVLRLGRKQPKKEGEPTWTSGWMLDRIQKIKQDWACKETKWRFNQKR